MGDSDMHSGAYEICSSVGIQKSKEVRLFMPMINSCNSKRRKTSTSSSDDDDNGFNGHEDLIWEILFRLPPEHVVRYKSVSKTWYSIISNPEFLHNHTLHRQHFLEPPHEFLLLPQEGEKEDLLLNLFYHQPLAHLSVLPITGVLPAAQGSDFVFVHSCNGLLLYADSHNNKDDKGFQCKSRVFLIDDDDDLYYLCNPVTKDCIKLPNLMHAFLFKEDDDDNKVVVYNNLDTRILFDPSVSLSYKVIRFVCRSVRGAGGDFQFYIYSSESGSWRLSASIACDFNFATRNSVTLNGVMYLITTGTDLFCFDAEKNSVWFQPLPRIPKRKLEHRQPFYFGKHGGRLCLIEKYSRTWMGRCDLTLYDGFDIMEMTTEDCRWTKKYHVNLEANHHHLIAAKIMVLYIYKTKNKEEEEEEEALLMKIDERIISFSLKTNTFGKELTIPNCRRPYGYADAQPTSFTLLPLTASTVNSTGQDAKLFVLIYFPPLRQFS